jgi:hypothetical protein
MRSTKSPNLELFSERCYLWWTCFSTDSRHTYRYKLCSSSRRLVPLFVRGRPLLLLPIKFMFHSSQLFLVFGYKLHQYGEHHIQHTIKIKHIMDMCKMLLAKYNTQYYTRQPHQQSCYSALSDDQIDPPGSPQCAIVRVDYCMII